MGVGSRRAIVSAAVAAGLVVTPVAAGSAATQPTAHPAVLSEGSLLNRLTHPSAQLSALPVGTTVSQVSSHDLAGGTRPEFRVGGDHAHLEVGHDQPFSFWICAHFSSTSLIAPTLKNACSATLSKSPRTIASNDSIVSFRGTVEPSTPVNFLAM